MAEGLQQPSQYPLFSGLQLAIGRRDQAKAARHGFPGGRYLYRTQRRAGPIEIGVHLLRQPLQLLLRQGQLLEEGEIHLPFLVIEVPVGQGQGHQALEHRHLFITADLPLQPPGLLPQRSRHTHPVAHPRSHHPCGGVVPTR